MDINRKLLEHVAEVARLKLTEEEIKKFLPQLKEALEFFSQLQEVDTEGVKPSFQPVEMRNAMPHEEALSLTEHKKDGYFKGPRAI